MIKIIKLKSGIDIVATVSKKGFLSFDVECPMTIEKVEDSEINYAKIVDFLAYSSDSKLTMSSTDIIAMLDVSEGFSEYYKEAILRYHDNKKLFNEHMLEIVADIKKSRNSVTESINNILQSKTVH